MLDPPLQDPSQQRSRDDADPYRPVFHYTPRRNWMNDPNGLVYFEGEYHLFYQYNPFGSQWGHMSWGHAVSPDLIHWTELPVAIPENDQMIFSGCAVIDRHNVSGLGDGESPAMLAFFTAFDRETEIQSQHLAYSLDRGRTFVHYKGNPLIDLDLLHFRDPKVFYHAPSAAWVMVVALSRDHKVQFYRSTNLLDWALASEFGPAGSTSGQWECPDLMLVPVEGGTAARKHVGCSKWMSMTASSPVAPARNILSVISTDTAFRSTPQSGRRTATSSISDRTSMPLYPGPICHRISPDRYGSAGCLIIRPEGIIPPSHGAGRNPCRVASSSSRRG